MNREHHVPALAPEAVAAGLAVGLGTYLLKAHLSVPTTQDELANLIGKFILSRRHTIVCREEWGEKENCEACGYCFRGKRGDVVFPIHGE